MPNIIYKKMKANEIDKNFLNGYIRLQETNRVVYVEDSSWKEKEDRFLERWTQKQLTRITKKLKRNLLGGGALYAAFHKGRVVGFCDVANNIFFGEYLNVPFVHTSKGYRGMGIGKKLFYLIALEAINTGANKLYISAHPAIETQLFYKSLGCDLATKINQELYDKEPCDIQLEKSLSYEDILLNLVSIEFENLGKVNALTIGKVASKTYRFLPKDNKILLDICEALIKNKKYGFFSVATLWLKKSKTVIMEDNIERFEDILYKHIHGWGEVDQFCYRVLNPMIELNVEFYSYLLKWSDSENKDIRRASLVSMIKSSQRQTLEYDFEKMIYLVDKLKHDEDIHVQKGVGWTLKCAYLKYPTQVEAYLRNNVKNLNRLIFRYALEHIENPLRHELIHLEVN